MNKIRITVDLSKTEHKKLKTLCAIYSKSIREVVRESIAEHFQKLKEDEEICMHSSHIPNAETIKAIKSKKFTEHKNPEDFFKKFRD